MKHSVGPDMCIAEDALCAYLGSREREVVILMKQ